MNHLFLVLIIQVFTFIGVNGLTFLKNSILDLESNLDYFQTEASYWTSTNTLSPSVATSQCDGTWLLGGDAVFGPSTTFARVYSSLPSHTQVYFSIYIWYIDLNQQTDLFDIYVENTKVLSINSDHYSSFNPPANRCGGSTKDFAGSRVDGKFSHSDGTLNFKLVSRSNSAFSIGFRQLTLLFSSPGIPGTSACQMQSSSYWLGTSCDCPEGKYDLGGVGGCTGCNGNCRTCTAVGSGDCTSCPVSYSFSGSTCFACDSSCLQCSATGATNCVRCPSNKFLYWNGTCLGSCVAPLKTTSEGEYQNCSLPCGSDFHFENNTCGASCPVANNFNQVSYGQLKICNFKCPGSLDYLYSNGSCIASCPYPFVEVVEGVERYCNFPCEGNYLYENGSCETDCDYPYVKILEGVAKYCNFSCKTGEYLYENGSCYSDCEYPFDIVTENSIENYCNFKCENSKYLYENGSCYSGCDSPPFVEILQGTEKYCNFTCESGEYLYQNGSCYSDCEYPFDIITQGFENYCNFHCESGFYLYENGSCYSGCDSPPFVEILQGTEKYCNFTCESDAYLYQNGSCYSDCEYPFDIVTQGLENYCNFHCENSEYLYGNGSCYSDCDSPPFFEILQGVEKYCNFSCEGSEYLYENNSCYSACPDPFDIITQGLENYCNFPCENSEHLYQNGSCYSGCSDPFFEILQGTEKYCNFTCPDSAKYLYENSSCYSDCEYPFDIITSGVENYCNFHCESGFYLYENGSCSSDCDSPFVKILQGTEKYCNFTCPSSAKYLYENSSCHSTCPSPLETITQGSESYCDFPCSNSEYLYPNGSCYSTCSGPFSNITKGTENYCNFPCETSEYYLLNTGECISSCPSPSSIASQGVEKYCNLPCPTNEYYFIDTGKCVPTCKAPLEITKLNRVQACKSVPSEPAKSTFGGALQSVFTGSALIGGLLRPNNLNSAFMVALAKLLKYVQYLDIDFPQDIRDGLTQNSSAGGFCITQMFSFEMPESLKEQLPQYSLPHYIEQSGVHSSYLVNHWQTMSSYAFLLMLGFAFAIFERIVLRYKWHGFSLVVTRLRVILKWNFLLFAFFNTFDDLTFFAILELRTLHLNSFMSVLSFIVCLVMSSIAIFVLYKAWKVSRESLKRANQVLDMENSNSPSMIFHKKWEDFQVLYAGLKGDSKIKQYYLVLYTSRIIYYFTIAGVFYAYPMVQTIQYLLWSIVMMYILLRKRPIVDCFGYIVNLTYETLVFIVNVCLVILVGSSQTNHLSESTQYTLSKTVLVCNSLVYFFSSLFSWIYILTGIVSAYRTSKKKKGLAAKTAWLTVPVSPYSNPGMDFDDLTYETEESLAEKDLIITLSYPKRARISSKRLTTNKIVPIDVATATTEAKSSMKSILSLHWSSKNETPLRETLTSDLFSRRSFAFGQQPNDNSLQSFAKVKLMSQNGYQSNDNSDSVNLDFLSPKKPDPRLRTKPNKEKALCLSIDEFMDGNDEDKLKLGLSEFFSDDNISRVNSPLNSAKNQSEGLIKIQGLENNIAGESSDDNSIRNIQENSPKSLLFNHNLQLPRRERGSLYATFLSSQFSPMARKKRQSMFNKDTSFARNNFQETVENLENGSGGSLSFNLQEIAKVQKRKRARKEDSNTSLSILRTGSGSNSQN